MQEKTCKGGPPFTNSISDESTHGHTANSKEGRCVTQHHTQSASGAPAGRGTPGERGGTGGAPRRPAEADRRAPPPPPSVPARRRPAAPRRDRGRQRPPLPSPRRPRPPPLPPAAAAPAEATATTITAATATATTGVGANVRAAVAGDERRPPFVPFAAGGGGGWSLSRTPPRDLVGFLWELATANQSYC